MTNSITNEGWNLVPVEDDDETALVASGEAMLDVLGASPSSPFHIIPEPMFLDLDTRSLIVLWHILMKYEAQLVQSRGLMAARAGKNFKPEGLEPAMKSQRYH